MERLCTLRFADDHFTLSTALTFCMQPWKDSRTSAIAAVSSKLRWPPINKSRVRVSCVNEPVDWPLTTGWSSTCIEPWRPVLDNITECHSLPWQPVFDSTRYHGDQSLTTSLSATRSDSLSRDFCCKNTDSSNSLVFKTNHRLDGRCSQNLLYEPMRILEIRPRLLIKSNDMFIQAGRRLVRSLLTLRVFVVDVMDLRTGNRNEDDS